MSLAEFVALGVRMGLEGAELKAWSEKQEARARAERAAELEEERRARIDELEIEEIKQRTLLLKLKLANALKTRLKPESHDMPSVSIREDEFQVCSRNRSCKGELDSVNKTDLQSHHNISLEPGVRLEDGIETGSQGTRKNLAELDEAEQGFGSKEQRSSIKDELCITTSGRKNTCTGEARLPLNDVIERTPSVLENEDGEYRRANSEFDGDSPRVLHGAASADSGMVENHANSLPLNTGSFTSRLSGNEVCRKESQVSAEAHIKTGKFESQVEPSVNTVVGSRDELTGMISCVEEPANKSVRDRNRMSVHCSLNNTKADAYLVASSQTKGSCPEIWHPRPVDRSGNSVDAPNAVTRTPLRHAWKHRVHSYCHLRSLGAANSAGRPSIVVELFRKTSGQKRVQAALVVSSKYSRCAVRLVWDAIT